MAGRFRLVCVCILRMTSWLSLKKSFFCVSWGVKSVIWIQCPPGEICIQSWRLAVPSCPKRREMHLLVLNVVSAAAAGPTKHSQPWLGMNHAQWKLVHFLPLLNSEWVTMQTPLRKYKALAFKASSFSHLRKSRFYHFHNPEQQHPRLFRTKNGLVGRAEPIRTRHTFPAKMSLLIHQNSPFNLGVEFPTIPVTDWTKPKPRPATPKTMRKSRLENCFILSIWKWLLRMEELRSKEDEGK